jgi:retron-type reverse transcriptase
MKIKEESIKWALTSLEYLGDSDLFARPIELSIIKELADRASLKIASLDLSSIPPGPARRFIVPKDDLSYRTATQLDPLNSIILTALVYEFGNIIEEKRRPKDEKTVFSYRFAPNSDGQLYDSADSWNNFWGTCYTLSKSYKFAVILDIADFYNQISHHSLENQLIDAGLPNQAIKWIVGLCGSLSAKVSRGVPVGPHASHLLAEAILTSIDNTLVYQGITFCRYVDDIILFAQSETEARSLILSLANSLDKQQKLLIQRHKTKILASDKFRNYCLEMVEDRPIDDLEKELIVIIRKHSHGNPYRVVWLSELSSDELSKFRPEVIDKILTDYLAKDEPDYIRLRWFIRRLAQIGHPAGVNIFLREFSKLLPAMSEICRYFLAVSQVADLEWKAIGHDLLDLFSNEIVKSNEYFQLSILSLFSAQEKLNNLPGILQLYQNASPYLRREIIICAAKHGASDWLRELKEGYPSMDPWNHRAYLFATSLLPAEERKFFLKYANANDLIDELIISWSKSK